LCPVHFRGGGTACFRAQSAQQLIAGFRVNGLKLHVL